MRFGCCFGSDTDLAAALKDAGFDYGEPQIKHLTLMEDDEFRSFVRKIEKIGLPLESGCVMLAGGLPLNRMQRDFDALDTYIKKAALRCRAVGMKTAVFGSGGARCAPEGLSREALFEDVVEFLRDHAAPAFSAVGMRIAIEPLSERPCLINTVSEAIELADAVADENVQVLADNYHMYNENDPIEGIAAANGRLIHAHICTPNLRRIPAPGDGFDPYAFLKVVTGTGCKRVTIEARVVKETFADEVRYAIGLLRDTQAKIDAELNR